MAHALIELCLQCLEVSSTTRHAKGRCTENEGSLHTFVCISFRMEAILSLSGAGAWRSVFRTSQTI